MPSIVNVTVPPAVLGVTVAVKVTDWPTVDGLGNDVMDVDVVIRFTACVKDKLLPA